jgi:hypothetical protein
MQDDKVFEKSGMGRNAIRSRELIRARQKEYRIWLGGVNGEIKIVIT